MIYLKMEILLQKVDFGARYALHLILTKGGLLVSTKSSLTLALFLLLAGTFVSAGQTPQVAYVAAMRKGIIDLKVQLGEKVKTGQLVFEVNQDILKAQKKFNKQNLSYTKTIFSRAVKLIKDSSISIADYQETFKDYINGVEALKLTKIAIKHSKYYAPFDGTVTNIVNYNGSGLNDNDTEVEITRGDINVKTKHPVATVSSRYAGIMDLRVKLGQTVKKGDLLFKINTANFETQKVQANNLLTYYKKIYERRKKLYKTKTVSLYLFATAENDYNKAQMNLAIADLQIKQSSFYAPFDGKVTNVYRYSGSGNGACKPGVAITKK